MPLITLVSEAAWSLAYFQGPFLLVCSKVLIARLKLSSPFLVIPGIASSAAVLFFEFTPNLYYVHFPIDAACAIFCYANLLRWKYDRTDSLILTACAIILCDQLWQIPFDFQTWTNPTGLALGILTSGFPAMSLPIMLYFVRRPRVPKKLLAFCLVCSAESLVAPIWTYYGLFFVWFVFFLGFLRRSRPEVVGQPYHPLRPRRR